MNIDDIKWITIRFEGKSIFDLYYIPEGVCTIKDTRYNPKGGLPNKMNNFLSLDWHDLNGEKIEVSVEYEMV
jgi:hypothetical protein